MKLVKWAIINFLLSAAWFKVGTWILLCRHENPLWAYGYAAPAFLLGLLFLALAD